MKPENRRSWVLPAILIGIIVTVLGAVGEVAHRAHEIGPLDVPVSQTVVKPRNPKDITVPGDHLATMMKVRPGVWLTVDVDRIHKDINYPTAILDISFRKPMKGPYGMYNIDGFKFVMNCQTGFYKVLDYFELAPETELPIAITYHGLDIGKWQKIKDTSPLAKVWTNLCLIPRIEHHRTSI